MAWKLTEVPDDTPADEGDVILEDVELGALRFALEPHIKGWNHDNNIYWRAYRKLLPAIQKALDNWNKD